MIGGWPPLDTSVLAALWEGHQDKRFTAADAGGGAGGAGADKHRGSDDDTQRGHHSQTTVPEDAVLGLITNHPSHGAFRVFDLYSEHY